MSTEKRLQALMQKGWNIHIECKSKGREYELTYEATGNKVAPLETVKQGFVMSLCPVHVYGDSLDELLTSLESKIANHKEETY